MMGVRNWDESFPEANTVERTDRVAVSISGTEVSMSLLASSAFKARKN
jgi:hypothetical protein